MPYKPARPCRRSGCPVVTKDQWCPKHEHLRPPDGWGKGFDVRPSPIDRGYDYEWRKVRAKFIYENPLCNRCENWATEVHHKIRLAEGGGSEVVNLEALCKSCHSSHTLTETNKARREAGQ